MSHDETPRLGASNCRCYCFHCLSCHDLISFQRSFNFQVTSHRARKYRVTFVSDGKSASLSENFYFIPLILSQISVTIARRKVSWDVAPVEFVTRCYRHLIKDGFFPHHEFPYSLQLFFSRDFLCIPVPKLFLTCSLFE